MSTLASVILKGVYSAIPSASIPGRLYFATDTNVTYRDNGTSWDVVTSAGGSGSGQTTVSGSTSGSAVFSQPAEGAYSKKVLIYLGALSGTASYTFPAAFSVTPDYTVMSAASGASVSALSASAVTIAGTGQTGFIVIEGY